MRTARRLQALFLVGTVVVAGACGGGDNATIDDSNLPTASSAPPAANACDAVRQDVERLQQTLRVPDGIDELKQVLADGLDHLDGAVRSAGDLTGEGARPIQVALGRAAASARTALAAVADGDFGTARKALGRATDGVRQASDALAAACAPS